MGLRTMLYYQGLAEQNAAIGQKLDIESEPIVNAAIEQEIDTQYVPIVTAAAIAETKRLRLSGAAPILMVLIAADSIIWSDSSDAYEQENKMIEKALKFADLLIRQA